MAGAASKEREKAQAEAAAEHLCLVDGSGYIFRAYHALPPLTTSDGAPVGAVHGFCAMLQKLIDDLKASGAPSHLVIVFDSARKTFRNDIYPAYKANRDEPPEDLVPQFALVRSAAEAFNVPSVELEGYEADDLIATYARLGRERGMKVTIVSSDKDLMQLVTPGVALLDTMKNQEIGPEKVMERFGVPPEKVVEVQALAGDSTDNVPGVPGIGVKTAALLINEYGDLDTLLAHAAEIKQPKRRQSLIENADLARLSRDLVHLRDDVPVEPDLDRFDLRDPVPEALLGFLDRMEFKSLKAKVVTRFGLEDLADETVPLAGDGGEVGYETVTTHAALERWIAEARDAGIVAVDTETTSLDAMRAALVGLSLSIVPGCAAYIPVGHRANGAAGAAGGGELAFEGGNAPVQLPLEEALALLKPMLEDPCVLKAGQNLKYDRLVLLRYGIELAPIDDTMLISYALDGGSDKHGMDALAARHLDYKTVSFKEVAGTGRNQVTFDQVPIDKATHYAAEDADITLRLHRLLKPRLVAEHMVTVYETLERPMVRVLVDMERAGIKVEKALLEGLSQDFAERLRALEGEIHELAGREFNIGSPKQLGEILFDEMGLASARRGKTGTLSTSADILEGLAAEGHALPQKVLDWRQLAKLKSTYTDALQDAVNPETGRVHTSYALAATSTGRLASSDPNLQNIPVRTEEGRKIRHAFVAEEGTVLIDADYSQIELRVLAHMAGIDALKAAFAKGLDIHAMTASEIFGLPIEGMDPMVRRRAKAINFGIIYGISGFGLSRQLQIPQREAQSYIDAYFERFPGIRDYMDETKAFAREHGFVRTLFGRKCHTPGIAEKNPARRGFAERAAINAPIQGTAADIIRRAMIRMPDALAEAGLGARMLLQVHDELIFEAPEGQADETADVVRRVMAGAAGPAVALDMPLVVDLGRGRNWDEAH